MPPQVLLEMLVKPYDQIVSSKSYLKSIAIVGKNSVLRVVNILLAREISEKTKKLSSLVSEPLTKTKVYF